MMQTPRGRWLGAKRSSPDHRDHRFMVAHPQAASAQLPVSVDLHGSLPPCFDQGSLGSCGPQSGIGFMASLFPKAPPLSALGLYFDIRTMEGTVPDDAGVETRDVFKALKLYGVAPESDWPYVTAKFALPLPADYAKDAEFKLGSYSRLATEADYLKSLAIGFRWILGFEVPDYFDSDELANHGVFWLSTGAPKIIGGHDVLVVGYDLNFRKNPDFLASGVDPSLVQDEALLIRNSWGMDWGLKSRPGHFWMPMSYASNPSTGNDGWTGRIEPAAAAVRGRGIPMIDGVPILGHFLSTGGRKMPEDPKVVGAEYAAGLAAGKAGINAKYPQWQIHLIPNFDENFGEIVGDIVLAVDKARADALAAKAAGATGGAA